MGKKKKPKPNPEKSSVDFLGVRPYCSPSLCPAHPTLLCLAQTRPGRAPCACAARVRHAKQTQQHSDQSPFQLPLFPVKDSPWVQSLPWQPLLELHSTHLGCVTRPRPPRQAQPAYRCDSGHQRQPGWGPQSSKATANSSSFLLNWLKEIASDLNH